MKVLNFFEPFLGRIEIKTADKIERVYFEIDENNIEQWEKPQIKESKRAFFYATITEGGDKEKLECFVDFCEDAIFEMQHAESLMTSDDGSGGRKAVTGPTLPADDAPRSVRMSHAAGQSHLYIHCRGILEPLKECVGQWKSNMSTYLKFFTISNLLGALSKAKKMTKMELFMALVTGVFWTIYLFGSTIIHVLLSTWAMLLSLMRGDIMFNKRKEEKGSKSTEKGGILLTNTKSPFTHSKFFLVCTWTDLLMIHRRFP